MNFPYISELLRNIQATFNFLLLIKILREECNCLTGVTGKHFLSVFNEALGEGTFWKCTVFFYGEIMNVWFRYIQKPKLDQISNF